MGMENGIIWRANAYNWMWCWIKKNGKLMTSKVYIHLSVFILIYRFPLFLSMAMSEHTTVSFIVDIGKMYEFHFCFRCWCCWFCWVLCFVCVHILLLCVVLNIKRKRPRATRTLWNFCLRQTTSNSRKKNFFHYQLTI